MHQALISLKSLGKDLSSGGSFRIDGQRLYNLAIHNNYAAHSILIDVKGKGFQFYTFTFGLIDRQYFNTKSTLLKIIPVSLLYNNYRL